MRMLLRAGSTSLAALVLVVGVFAWRASAATISLNAVYEPMVAYQYQQKFIASWTNAGWAYIGYDDGTYGPFWNTDDGSKTNYHNYPCVNGNTTRVPALFTGQGYVEDSFIQDDSIPGGNCPQLSPAGPVGTGVGR